MLSSSLNSTIVPLFEKVLSASDAGRIGRLVLPKACAEVSFQKQSSSIPLFLVCQLVLFILWRFFFLFICINCKSIQAYFPPISQSEGLPLRVQDAKGTEWTFQFRFWPNNNSRMYVLEGVTPCIQSMQLRAGDTGIFHLILSQWVVYITHL